MNFLQKLRNLNYIKLASVLVVGYLLLPPAMLVYDGVREALHSERDPVEKHLPPLNLDIYIDANKPMKDAVIQLYRNGEFYCTAFVIGNNYALTAGHCLMDQETYERTAEEIDIRLQGKATGTKAKAVGIDYRRDLGLIQGDFKEYARLQVQNQELAIEKVVAACGFPGGNKNYSCTHVSIVAFDGFFLRGMGMLQPGMSGGPVVNPSTNEVIGINSSAWPLREGGGVDFTSVLGVLGDFGIEP